MGNCEKTAIFAQLTKFPTKMATTADIKIGMCIELNGKTYQIVDFQHVKPGKGPAFVRTKLKNLENGRTVDNTFTASVVRISSCTRMIWVAISCTRRRLSRL